MTARNNLISVTVNEILKNAYNFSLQSVSDKSRFSKLCLTKDDEEIVSFTIKFENEECFMDVETKFGVVQRISSLNQSNRSNRRTACQKGVFSQPKSKDKERQTSSLRRFADTCSICHTSTKKRAKVSEIKRDAVV